MKDSGPYLVEAAAFIERFRGDVVVVKLGGELHVEPVIERIVPQLAVLRQCGLLPVVVHGGGKQIDELCVERGIPIEKIGGRRITNPQVMAVVEQVVGGQLNRMIADKLAARGVRARGHAEGVTRAVRCRRRPPREVEGRRVDFGLVGDIDSIDLELLGPLDAWVPVLPSLGTLADGTLVNVNADSVAARVAVATGAQKLVMLSRVAGVMGHPGAAGPISALTRSQAAALFDGGQIQGGMRAKLEEALRAIDEGVPQVQIISGIQPHTLLREIFTVAGCGTLITGDSDA